MKKLPGKLVNLGVFFSVLCMIETNTTNTSGVSVSIKYLYLYVCRVYFILKVGNAENVKTLKISRFLVKNIINYRFRSSSAVIYAG